MTPIVRLRNLRALLVLFFTYVPPVAANWDATGAVQELGSGITPGICTEASGAIHVVYMAGGGIFYRHADRSGRFGAPEPVPVPEGPAAYNSPHLACGPDGVVHLVFERDFTARSQRAWYSNRHNGKWRHPVLALDRTGTERRINYPRLAVRDTTVFIGAFAGGGSAVVKLMDVTSKPRIAASVDTGLWAAHPLLNPAGGIFVFGRAGSRGHKLEQYSDALELNGEPLLLSRDTPNKTGEPTTAIIDSDGVVHVAGVTRATPTTEIFWYNTSTRAAEGRGVVPGLEVGDHVKEFTYPILLKDARQRIYVSYRHHGTGEGRLTVFDTAAGNFAPPVAIATSITARLRWNPHLAAAPEGGVYIVWDNNERVYFRAVGEAARSNSRRLP